LEQAIAFLSLKNSDMKNRIIRRFVEYVYNNYVGNFLGFAIGLASTRLISHYFATRKPGNLWGLASRKTILDKHTYSTLEWTVSLVIGFIVFEIVSKWLKKKMDEILPKYRLTQWMVEQKDEKQPE
jgi:hypothetical protein